MAPTGVEEVEYDSDPEELKRSLTMRRKEASDDEDDEDDRRGNRKAEIRSDESDGQGGVADYDNDEDGELGIDGEDGEDSYDEEEEDIEEGDDDREYAMGNEKRNVAGKSEGKLTKEMEVDRRRNGEESVEDDAVDHMDEEEEKEKEPFAVPTAGAFYMHDDRFQENSGGRHRRMRGGRKLWESRDDGKWGHDKFEEMNKQEKQYEMKRTSRGKFRGRGRGRLEHRYARGSSSKTFNRNRNQNQFPEVVTRGRGPRRYETAMRDGNQAPSAQNKQSWNSLERTSRNDIRHVAAPISSSEIDVIQAKKNVVASSLNSASPPFYPSGSSNNLTQKDIQVGMGRLQINESTSTTGKNSGNAKIPFSGSSLVSTTRSSMSVSQGRGAPAPGQVMYQQSLNQVDRVSSPMQCHGSPKVAIQSCIQPSAQTSDKQSTIIRSLSSSPPKTSSSKNSSTSGDMESSSETVAKGKGSFQASGRGSFLYGGTQVMGPAGSLAVGHDNPNFPAFLPVMQFGGQHGGVPTFGMAFPGYVAQSEHGLGNSEMTWLPILTGPGALGATYCSPYAPVEGSYVACKPGLPSSLGSSSKGNNTSKPNNELRPPERPELTNDEIPQQQDNSSKQLRRYSEMSFSK